MVLAAVDDLLFSSKIRATAKQAGVDVTFARSPQEILDQANGAEALAGHLRPEQREDRSGGDDCGAQGRPRAERVARSRVRLARAHRAHRLGAERGRRSGAAAVCVRRRTSPTFSCLPRAPPLITRADVEAAAARLVAVCAAHAAAALGLALVDRRSARLAQARNPPGNLLLQVPRRAERGAAPV